MEIKVHGRDVPRPIVSFAHLNFDEKITNLIIKKQFEKPTPIQCQVKTYLEKSILRFYRHCLVV